MASSTSTPDSELGTNTFSGALLQPRRHPRRASAIARVTGVQSVGAPIRLAPPRLIPLSEAEEAELIDLMADLITLRRARARSAAVAAETPALELGLVSPLDPVNGGATSPATRVVDTPKPPMPYSESAVCSNADCIPDSL